MVLAVLRALFVLLMVAVGWAYIQDPRQFQIEYSWLAVGACLCVGVLFICIDILAPRRKLAIFSGTFLGLIVGILIAYGLSFAVHLVIEQFAQPDRAMTPEQLHEFNGHREALEQYLNMLLGVVSCYLAISFILQTKDDFRFIVPYVEFARQTKGARPIVLDTSVLIDGRIADIAQTGILENRLIVPRFILVELQAIADSSDKLRRNRGRRGLDVLARLQNIKRTEIILYDSSGTDNGNDAVDQKLMALAAQLEARVLTTDFNLNKVAQLRGVNVININDLANALKPAVLPGEKMIVRIIKGGEQPGQGVGYLDDGTMVVVEQARQYVDQEVEFTVTSPLQTSAGKMIFGRINAGEGPIEPRRAKPSAIAPT